ncbi:MULTISPECIES: peptidylprolyl isomerase [Thalassolituus]|uniref:peptidylprolyl isomerase n=2 Tax=Oceanospirillaceae TaxID=135620 RepID=UPI000C598F27|nr:MULTISPECIES: peptidylprolyl isomerase [Thalassolituus]MAX87560.1 peptidylprolyl isomerase [Oceanospirillaceae bacterium]MEC9254663.1 peptidylprolyl isomerase [Pseudomonadota bacterium]MEE3210310.1 peptidylprolyl isomerase [Pseudomonadota bacterium]|tara:strand:+ start:12051 stop:12332 length:282 start_codon:yes stop_codon:yes gene_type:complete
MANRACACHILVKTREEAESLLKQLNKGAEFDKLARKHSTCPSGKQGGSLGEFGRNDMVKPFVDAVFKGPLLKVQGPVKTKFGWHLIKTLYRQ